MFCGRAVITDAFLDALSPGLTAAAFCTDNPAYCLNTAKDTFEPTPGSTRFSVVRTGAADLDLLSARGLNMSSLFGVYTAGTSSTTTSTSDPYNLPRVLNLQNTFLGDADRLEGRDPKLPLLLAPSANGKLEFLASDSIYAGGFMVARSSASASSLATPFNW